MKKYIWYILIAVLLGSAYGYYEYNRPVGSLEGANADVVLEASALLKAFETNEESANTQYLDKVIEVSGSISKIEEEGEKKKTYKNSFPLSAQNHSIQVSTPEEASPDESV